MPPLTATMVINLLSEYDEKLGAWKRMNRTPEELAYIRAMEQLRASASPVNRPSPVGPKAPITERAKEYLGPSGQFWRVPTIEDIDKRLKEDEDKAMHTEHAERQIVDEDVEARPAVGTGLVESQSGNRVSDRQEIIMQNHRECEQTSKGSTTTEVGKAAARNVKKKPTKRKRKHNIFEPTSPALTPQMNLLEADALQSANDEILEKSMLKQSKPRKKSRAGVQRASPSKPTEGVNSSQAKRRNCQVQRKKSPVETNTAQVASSVLYQPSPVSLVGCTTNDFGAWLQGTGPSLSYQRHTSSMSAPSQSKLQILPSQAEEVTPYTFQDATSFHTLMRGKWSSYITHTDIAPPGVQQQPMRNDFTLTHPHARPGLSATQPQLDMNMDNTKTRPFYNHMPKTSTNLLMMQGLIGT